jgi:hypothetical protein
VVNRKIPNPRRESNPTTPNVQPVAQRYTDWVIMVRTMIIIFFNVFQWSQSIFLSPQWLLEN